MQRWAAIKGTENKSRNKAGLCVINDSKYSASAEGNTLRIMIVRSPAYAHHAPYVLPENLDDSQFTDIGLQAFRYVIVPIKGALKESVLARRAEEWNQPCLVTTESYHEGPFPQSAQSVQISAPNVLLSALKLAEKENGWVLRCYEADGFETEVEIKLFQAAIPTRFRPYEIKTFLIESLEKARWREVDFLEWDRDKDRNCLN